MNIPFSFILSGIGAIKDIVSSFGNLNSDDKLKKVEEYIKEQNSINAQQVEFNKQQDLQIKALNSRIKRLEIIVAILFTATVVSLTITFKS